jgi:two-component system nitrogen regulation response regulator GlnG
MPKLLVVDDEPSVCYSFRRVFGAGGVEVLTAATASAALEQLRAKRPDVVVLDLQLPDRDGLDLFGELCALDPRRPVVFITAHGTTQTAIEAMKRGAFDYLVKPVDFERVSQVVARAFEATRLMSVPAVLPSREDGDRIIGRSPVMQEMCKAIGRIAPQDVNVLITGESGTGKELVARAIYQHSRRADRPFLAINCAAIPEPLLESELFGHEKGAFTGAVSQRIGKFEQCDGGTLLLDEVGDMTPALQAKILRVLQEQHFERLGGIQTVQTRVRVLAATNQDLDRLKAEGRFRGDLYYRLQAVTIRVPPLRDRREDIPELAHHFLFQFSRELGRDIRGFVPEALDAMSRHNWPGNVRELQGVIQQAVLQATGHMLLPEFLPPSLASGPPAATGADTDGTLDLSALIESLVRQGGKGLHEQVLRVVERALFTRVLRETHGHQGKASEMLGLHRGTLRLRLRELGISVDRTIHEGDPEQEPPT